jgi:hypothetical protein
MPFSIECTDKAPISCGRSTAQFSASLGSEGAAALPASADSGNPRPGANAAYIHLTDEELPGHHTTTKAAAPPEIKAWIALDWKAERLVGIEILDAAAHLPWDLLDQAETPT